MNCILPDGWRVRARAETFDRDWIDSLRPMGEWWEEREKGSYLYCTCNGQPEGFHGSRRKQMCLTKAYVRESRTSP